MKSLNRPLSILILITGPAVILGCGCCPTSSIAAAPNLAVEPQESRKLEVIWVRLEPAGDTAVLSGAIRQTGASPSPTTGHVDVEIRKPDGAVVYQAHSETMYIPRHIIGKGSSHKRFRIPLNTGVDSMSPSHTITLKACNDPQCPVQPI